MLTKVKSLTSSIEGEGKADSQSLIAEILVKFLLIYAGKDGAGSSSSSSSSSSAPAASSSGSQDSDPKPKNLNEILQLASKGLAVSYLQGVNHVNVSCLSALVREALERKSLDNVTCMLVKL